MGCGGASGWRAGSSARWRGSGASPPPSVREASPLSKAVSLRARRGSVDQLPGLEVELYHHQMPADIPCEFSLQTAGQLVQQLGVGELVPSQGREDGRLERLVVALRDGLVDLTRRVFRQYSFGGHSVSAHLCDEQRGPQSTPTDRYLGGVFCRRALSSSSPTSRNVPASAAPKDRAACFVLARTSGSLAATSRDEKNFSVACAISLRALLISSPFVSASASL